MKRLYARHRLDIRVSDLVTAAALMRAADATRAAQELEQRWSPDGGALACYSVRSGFHLMLTALDLPHGSEVLFSAVTHPDMPRLAIHHGLAPVPVDLDPTNLAPRVDVLHRALTARTRIFVVAHLFGGHVDLAPIADVCRQRDVLLVEDCAQAFWGPEDTGDELAPVSMFSFGILKTATALGGALLEVRRPALLARMRSIQRRWRVQRRRSHMKRIAQTAAFVALTRPKPYALLADLSGAVGADFDGLVNSAARAFPASSTAELAARLEQQPGAPLLRLLEHRLRSFDRDRIDGRASSGERLAALLPPGLHIGGEALDHTHWLFPVAASRAADVIEAARSVGFDAASRASSISPVAAPPGRPDLEPQCARDVMSRLVFLPAYPELPAGSLERLASALRREEIHARTPR